MYNIEKILVNPSLVYGPTKLQELKTQRNCQIHLFEDGLSSIEILNTHTILGMKQLQLLIKACNYESISQYLTVNTQQD